jgi:predicted nucleic acid-binding protein
MVCTEFFQNCTQSEAIQFLNARQQFIDIVAVDHLMSFPRRLDQGEHAVLSLAIKQSADILLIDDRKAFNVAQEYGMTVVSTRTILRMAEEKQLIPSFQEIEKVLQAKQFFLPSY